MAYDKGKATTTTNPGTELFVDANALATEDSLLRLGSLRLALLTLLEASTFRIERVLKWGFLG